MVTTKYLSNRLDSTVIIWNTLLNIQIWFVGIVNHNLSLYQIAVDSF